MSSPTLYWFGPSITALALVCAGCSAGRGSGFEETTEGAGAGSGSSGVGEGGFSPTTGSGVSPEDCDAADTEDRDKDGWTRQQGDCNDCDAHTNPGAIEVATKPLDDGTMPPAADEDCDGKVDDVLGPCDSGLKYADADPKNAARALDLCQEATNERPGVIDAAWVRADGAPYASSDLQHAIFDSFGPNVKPQLGVRLLALSSGYARVPGQPDACADMSCYANDVGNAPPGFPAAVPGCPGGSDIHDDVGLQVKLRVPTNATGYKFNFKFYSFEFAEWVCTPYNDQFIALVTPPPMGAQNGNIVFDSKNNPVSVNIAFFDVGDPNANNDFASECIASGSPSCPPKPNPYCPSGPAELAGTGFDDCFGSYMEDGGATSWLETTAPAHGGEEIEIRFAIWDTGDANLDSTVLVDGFQWIADGGVTVGTDPLEDPK